MTEEEIQTLQAELDSSRVQTRELEAELKGLTAEKGTLASELETKGAAITELEQIIVTKDNELEQVIAVSRSSEQSEEAAKQSLANAVSAYKAVVVQANPHITEELITGNTIDELNQSVEKAKTLIAQVRTSIEAEIASGKVPAGAPARTPPDLSALSPREKIQYAIGGKK